MPVFVAEEWCSCGCRLRCHGPMPDPDRREHRVPAPVQPERLPDPTAHTVALSQLEALPGEPPAWATRRQREIHALRLAGYSQVGIARLTGWSQSLVSVELANLLVTRPVTRDVDTGRILELRSRGLLQREIGRRLGVSQTTVSRHLLAAGRTS